MTIGEGRIDVLHGTLDEQVSDDLLHLNEGTVYASLLRLRQQGWIEASWGRSENNRRARFYAITAGGRRRLAAQTEDWERIAGVMARLLRGVAEGPGGIPDARNDPP